MEPISNSEVKTLIENGLNEAEVSVEGDGYKYQAVVVSSDFAGMSTLQRHKLVNSLLNKAITEGRLHALSLKTYTPEEHAK